MALWVYEYVIGPCCGYRSGGAGDIGILTRLNGQVLPLFPHMSSVRMRSSGNVKPTVYYEKRGFVNQGIYC